MNAFDLNYLGVDELVEDELIDVNGGQIFGGLFAGILGLLATAIGPFTIAGLLLAGIVGAIGTGIGGVAGMLLY